KECFPDCNNSRDNFIGPPIVILVSGCGLWIDETHQALIDRRLPNDFGTWQTANAGHRRMRMGARAFDQFGNAQPTELAQGGVGGHSTPPSRPFRVPIDLIAGVTNMHPVAGSM